MKTTYFIDIDGTIAQYHKRLTSAGPEPAREPFNKYQEWLDRIQTPEMLLEDKAVPGMRDLIYGLLYASIGHKDIDIVYLTAREENLRFVTESWLAKVHFPRFELIMRPLRDMRENHTFKEDVINSFHSDVNLIIDDDPSNKLAEVCRKNGWTMLKAITY